MEKVNSKALKPIDKEWKENIKNKWWATNYTGDKSKFTNEQKELLKLRDKLLSLGGEECCLQEGDEDLQKILTRGYLAIAVDIEDDVEEENEVYVMTVEGAPSQCHRNSVGVWLNHKDEPRYEGKLKIVTGYALTEDSMWRQHTWCIIEDIDNIDGYDTIIETTVDRVAYFGFIMDEDEMKEFASWY